VLAAGFRLGPYEIVAPLGAGGMGEVWRARDTRLGRDVAVKVLSQHLAVTDDARARLDREARAISGLNHPHICTLHDIGHENGIDYLVMELVEGETLTARLERGALPPAELLGIAIQIAEALDVAHRRGIVHRDLKPGNIMLTRSGAKLMDFGLARAASGPAAEPGSLSGALTVSRALTAEGTLVGTFLYMTPEQLEGKEADARSDLWALGCVLYEMATGRRAFEGKSQASLIGAIMHAEPPPIATAAPLTPPGLDRVVRACLAKDPAERIQTAHDVKLQLQWVAEGGSQAGVPIPVAARRRYRERLAWGLVAALGVVAVWGVATALIRQDPAPAVTRFALTPPKGARSMTWPRISPDGRLLAYQAADSLGRVMLWVRPLSALVANPLPGTEDAGRPFWSPDSRHVAYFIGNQLKKIAVAGGPPQLICETKSAADGAWGARDVILFDGAAGDSLRQVSANGGVASVATTLNRKTGENEHAWPCFLPDGRHFLYLAFGNRVDGNWILKVGTLGSSEAVVLGPVDSRAEFASPDLVLYTLDSTLMARRLDLRRWRWAGDPFPVAERVLVRGNGQANFSVSQNGVLATMGGGSSERSELVWVDRTGRRFGREGAPAGYRDLALSPDGAQLAYGVVDPKAGTQDLWVRDLKRGVASRLTFGDGNEIWPVWSPDGTRIAYAADAAGPYSLRAKPADGTGVEDSLYAPRYHTGPTDWSRDGRLILFVAYPEGNPDVWTLSAGGGGAARAIVSTSFNESNGCLSPDGRWLAYMSLESGRPEIYVRAFPGPGGKWQVSVGGGTEPQWRGDGRELFYRGDSGSALMAVPVTATAAFQIGAVERLFDATLTRSDVSRNRYEAAADGQRFLLNLPLESNNTDIFNVVLNWTAEVARK
jgi:Tol biopolymer transport system component